MYFKGALAFKEVIHPDGHHVRVHHACWELILGDGYKPLPGDTSRYLGAFRRAPNWRD